MLFTSACAPASPGLCLFSQSLFGHHVAAVAALLDAVKHGASTNVPRERKTVAVLSFLHFQGLLVVDISGVVWFVILAMSTNVVTKVR